MRAFSNRLVPWLNLILVITLLSSLLPVQLAQAAQSKMGQPLQPLANDVAATSAASIPAGQADASGLLFIENVGQYDAGARFMVRGAGGSLYLADDALWFTFFEQLPTDPSIRPNPEEGKPQDETNQPRRGVNLKLSFPGANPRPRLEPFNRLATRVSYFIGSNPAKWRPDVPVWGGVRYVDLYPGVDLEITGQNGQLVQRLVVRDTPLALTPRLGEGWGRSVRLRVEGADAITVAGSHLRLTTAVGNVSLPLLQPVTADRKALRQPVAPPMLDGEEIIAPFAPVSTASLSPLYISAGSAHLASPLRHSLTSPLQAGASDLLYGTYLGGSALEVGTNLAVDDMGNAYLTGYTCSSNFPTIPGSFDTNLDNLSDAFVIKLKADGSDLEYATFLGGSESELDMGDGVAIDEMGNAYLTGWTSADNFPLVGAFDTSHQGTYEAFVTKLNAAGTQLIYSSFLGGSGDDYGYDIALDTNNNAYITGYTTADNFTITPGAADEIFEGPGEIFVSKVNAGGTGLVYSTFVGGQNSEYGYAITVDGTGNAFITGYEWSDDFPTTPGAYLESHIGLGTMAFVTKLGAGGTTFIYSTLLGGANGDDRGYDIAVDVAGNAYVTGLTYSSDFPTTPDAFDRALTGPSDAFVTRLNNQGTGLIYSTFLGGDSYETGRGIIADASGNVYISGDTTSSDFPTTTDTFDTDRTGPSDAFVTKLNNEGIELIYSTFLGGDSYETGRGIAADASGNIYITGHTASSDFPTTQGAYQTGPQGEGDIFLAKLGLGNTSPLTLDVLDAQGGPVTELITNADGWPTPNPLQVRMTITNTTGAALANPALALTINSPYDLGYEGRFYVMETNGFDQGIYGASGFQYRVITGTLALAVGQTTVLTAQVWIQPSITTTLSFTAELYADADTVGQEDLLGQDGKQAGVPLAKMHPLIIVPGYVGTWPPEHGGDLDPLQKTYDNLIEAMQRIGYEWGDASSGATLIPFGWDWSAPFGDTGRNTLEADIDSIRDIANRTKSYVDYDQVDIIAHSAGGLVARAFIEDVTANNQDKVNLLITLGTPHRGTPAAYRGGRGGQYSAIFSGQGGDVIASGVTAGLLACKNNFWGDIAILWPGLIEDRIKNEIVLNEDVFHAFIRDYIPSTDDLLPTGDVTPEYLVDNLNPTVVYPYGNPPGTPPDNPFLADMSTTGGDYDVSKLLAPNIVSVFSSNVLPVLSEGIYRVDPPPSGQGDNVRWGHGEFVPPFNTVPGDGLIPAYSANLTQLSVLGSTSNITAFDAFDIHHLGLPAESSMVRRLIAYVTGIDVVNNATLWTKVSPQPLGQIEAVWELVTCSPVRTLVTDPLGRRAGLDPATGEIIKEIPGAIVTKDGDEPHLIIVPQVAGQYQVQTVGIDDGAYTIGALKIFSGTTEVVARVFTGTTSVGASRQFSFASSVFQEENGQVAMEAEHFNWRVGGVNRAWITQTTQAGYVGSGYVNTLPDVDQVYTEAFTSTAPQLEYTINFTTQGTYTVWIRGYAPNAAGDSVYVSLGDQPPTILTGLPPRQWAWQEAGLTYAVTEPGERNLFLWQREDGLKIDRILLTTDPGYNPQGNGPNESPRIGDD